MKTLKPYNEDCFEVHKNAVNSKNKGDLKERLTSLHPEVEIEFEEHSKNFKSNTLGLQIANLNLAKSKDDLLTLYEYQNKAIRDLRESIKKLQVRTIISTCQNCTVDTVNSMDHILPKAGFPEFIVNPQNLFPCCTTCNSYKLNRIEDSSGPKFLNLYLDVLPQSQYLFVDVIIDSNGDLDYNYFLNNSGNLIPTDFFELLESHYNKLHLFERFKLKSIEYESELTSKIFAFSNHLSIDEIIEDITLSIIDEKNAYGDNHWKCILESTLIRNDLFMKRFAV